MGIYTGVKPAGFINMKGEKTNMMPMRLECWGPELGWKCECELTVILCDD